MNLARGMTDSISKREGKILLMIGLWMMMEVLMGMMMEKGMEWGIGVRGKLVRYALFLSRHMG